MYHPHQQPGSAATTMTQQLMLGHSPRSSPTHTPPPRPTFIGVCVGPAGA